MGHCLEALCNYSYPKAIQFQFSPVLQHVDIWGTYKIHRLSDNGISTETEFLYPFSARCDLVSRSNNLSIHLLQYTSISTKLCSIGTLSAHSILLRFSQSLAESAPVSSFLLCKFFCCNHCPNIQ